MGASFAGLDLLPRLWHDHNITLIDKTNYFEFLIGYYHEYSKDGAYKELVRDYDMIFKDKSPQGFRFLQGELLKVAKGDSILIKTEDGEEEINYDELILCTGSDQPMPHKDFGSKTSQERYGKLKEEVDKARQATKVLVVGAGIVGVEVAAEIAENAKKNGQEVGIVSRPNKLLPECPKKA